MDSHMYIYQRRQQCSARDDVNTPLPRELVTGVDSITSLVQTCCALPTLTTSSQPTELVLARKICQRLLFTLGTLRHPHTSTSEGDVEAASAVLLYLEAAALQDVEVSKTCRSSHRSQTLASTDTSKVAEEDFYNSAPTTFSPTLRCPKLRHVFFWQLSIPGSDCHHSRTFATTIFAHNVQLSASPSLSRQMVSHMLKAYDASIAALSFVRSVTSSP